MSDILFLFLFYFCFCLYSSVCCHDLHFIPLTISPFSLGKEKVSQSHFATAKQLFQLAGDAKYAAAVCALGWWYCHGYGLPSEEYLGFELYQKAAAQGDKTAQNNVGYCYQYGIGLFLF